MLLFLNEFAFCNKENIETVKNYNYQEIEKNAYKFLKDNLVTKEGGIYSNYYTDYYPLDPDDGQNHEILSESIGLYLEYLFFSKRKREFQKEVEFLTKYLLRPSGLISWKIDEKGKTKSSSATIDDLRIVRYLILAGKNWKNSHYIRLAKKIGDANLKYCSKDDILLDGASWEKSYFKEKIYKNLNVGITLSYIDLFTIKLLSQIDKEKASLWKDLFDRGLLLIYHGYKNNRFATKYNIRKKRYIWKKQSDFDIINTTTILHLTEVDLAPISAVNSFDIDTELDDIASYALVTRIFINLGDDIMSEYFLHKMLEFIIPKGPLKGGFGYYMKKKKRYKVYAFDNLLALTTLRKYQIFIKERRR